MAKRVLQLKSKIPSTPKQKREASLYALWLSVPIALRDSDMEKLQKLDYMNGAGMEDFIKVLKCRTKKDFGKEFHVSISTLCKWDRASWLKDLIDKFSLDNNVMRFKKDIDFNFTQKTMEEADPARVKLWKQVYEGWSEKKQLSGEFDIKNILDDLED